MSDPAITGLRFDLEQCPSLLRLLDALHLGNQNPTVACEMSCVQQFAQVGTWAGRREGDLCPGHSLAGPMQASRAILWLFSHPCMSWSPPAPPPTTTITTRLVLQLNETCFKEVRDAFRCAHPSRPAPWPAGRQQPTGRTPCSCCCSTLLAFDPSINDLQQQFDLPNWRAGHRFLRELRRAGPGQRRWPLPGPGPRPCACPGTLPGCGPKPGAW